MTYLKKELDAQALAAIRVNLSTRDQKLSPEPVCDWCGEAEPVVVYASKRMANGRFQQCWRWIACPRCERMIERENWDALRRRVTARFKKFYGAKLENRFGQGAISDDLIQDSVKVSLDAFFEYGIQATQDPGGTNAAH
jgi:hypothetical protein